MKFSVVSLMSFHLDLNFVAGEPDRISLQRASARPLQARAGADIEHRLVQRALDRAVIDETLREQRVRMRTDVLERIDVVADAVDPDLDAVGPLELDRRIRGQRAGMSGANLLFIHLNSFFRRSTSQFVP